MLSGIGCENNNPCQPAGNHKATCPITVYLLAAYPQNLHIRISAPLHNPMPYKQSNTTTLQVEDGYCRRMN